MNNGYAHPSHSRNLLLRALEPGDLERVLAAGSAVDLPVGETLVGMGETIRYVYFVESGLVSLLTGAENGRDQIEVAIVGREGLCGLPVALGCTSSPFRAVVQRPATAYRIATDAFTRLGREVPALQSLVFLYAQVFTTQLAENGRANARLTVEARLARWLLMAHDRCDDDQLPLTHETLAHTLGVRRPGITVSLHLLEGERMIRARRGNIQILDRSKLEIAARGSYGLPESEYQRLIPSRAGHAGGR